MTKITRKAGERLMKMQKLSTKMQNEAGYTDPSEQDILAYEQAQRDLEAHYGNTMDYASMSRLRV